jgi:hypothetical protein
MKITIEQAKALSSAAGCLIMFIDPVKNPQRPLKNWVIEAKSHLEEVLIDLRQQNGNTGEF